MLRGSVVRGALRLDDVAFLDQKFIQTLPGNPLRHALLGASPMTPLAQEEHVRKAVDLFLRVAAAAPVE
jgi:AefR-like transcriptional repressor, C-terminal domain